MVISDGCNWRYARLSLESRVVGAAHWLGLNCCVVLKRFECDIDHEFDSDHDGGSDHDGVLLTVLDLEVISKPLGSGHLGLAPA